MNCTNNPNCRLRLLWCLVVFLGVFSIAGLVCAKKLDKVYELSADVEVSVEGYKSPARKPGTGIAIIWLPSENGLDRQQKEIAANIASMGTDVYLADLHSAYFVAKTSSSIKQFLPQHVALLIEKIQVDSGKKIVLISSGLGVIALLKGARQWQQQSAKRVNAKTDRKLLGAILISGKYYSKTPEPGADGVFEEIVKQTNLVIMMVQPKNSPWFWKLKSAVKALSSNGSNIFTWVIPGIRDRFYYRPDATETEIRVAAKMATLVTKTVQILSRYQIDKKLEVKKAVKKERPPKNSRRQEVVYKDRILIPYQGKFDTLPLNLPALDNINVNIKSLKGQVLLVNFWASWCPPCVHEMPSMQKLSDLLIGQPFKILAVNMGEKPAIIRKFLKESVSVDFTILLDLDGAALTRWKVYAFPTSYILDKNGKIRYAVFGAIDWSSKSVLRIVNKLLAE